MFSCVLYDHGSALTVPPQGKPLKPACIDYCAHVFLNRVYVDPVDLPVREPIATLIEMDEATPLCQFVQQGAPGSALPLILDMALPHG